MSNIIRLSQIDFENIEVVFQQEVVQQDRPEYTNKFRKILFFVLREGIALTLRKISSKKASKRFTSCKYLVILKVSIGDKAFYNFSIQVQLNPSNYVVINKFYDLNEDDLSLLTSNWKLYINYFNQFNNDLEKLFSKEVIQLPIRDVAKDLHQPKENYGIVIIGLGDYSRTYIAPCLKGQNNLACIDYNIFLTNYFQQKFKFKKSGLTPFDALNFLRDIDAPLLIIASYHSDHSWIAEKAYQENKNTLIFIEKPPCVTLDDLKRLVRLYQLNANIEIGFNRRHIPYNKKVKSLLVNKGPKIISISIKEIRITEQHWYFWENQGTRITGNVVHWIDIAQYWIDATPVEISLLPSLKDNETFALSVQYEDGSLLNIAVSDNGNSLRGVQEKIEIRFGNETIFIDDYISMKYTDENGAWEKTYKLRRDKGHRRMYQYLMKLYREEAKGCYPMKDLIATTMVTYFASFMYRNGFKNLNISKEIKEFTQLMNTNNNLSS